MFAAVSSFNHHQSFLAHPHLSRAKEAVEDLAEADAHACNGLGALRVLLPG